MLYTDKGYPIDLSLAQETKRRSMTPERYSEIAAGIGEKTVPYSLGPGLDGPMARAYINPGDGSDRAVLVPGEFGNGITPAAVVRAELIAAALANDEWGRPTVVYVPNDALGQRNAHYSGMDLWQMWHRGTDPLYERSQRALDAAGLTDDSKVVAVGMSQGTVPALRIAATRPTATVGVEAPHVDNERSTFRLMRDFIGSSATFEQTLRGSLEGIDPKVVGEFTKVLGTKATMLYYLGVVEHLPTSLAVVRAMTHGASEQVAAALDAGSSVMWMHGDRDSISPLGPNDAIAAAHFSNARFDRLIVPDAGHDVTNNYPLVMTLARRASQLVA